MKTIMVAFSKKGHVIGDKGRIPWMGQLPIDMKLVYKTTVNQAIIMGYKTYESIGWPLPDRQNIVLTSRNFKDGDNGCVDVVRSLDEAFAVVEPGREAYIFGGAQVYAASMDLVDRIYATEIYGEFEGDAFFPEIDPMKWRVASRKHYPIDAKNKFAIDFVEYLRR